MKKSISLILAILLVITFALFAIGSGESDSESASQGNDTAQAEENNNEELGDYSVIIDSCRLAKDFEGKDIVIVKYNFTNNSDDSASFMFAFEDTVYQDGIGLNRCYFADDNANYSEDNQTKEIKTGATLDVEVAYELNDTTTDIEVEVKELISLSDKTITKTFSIK